MNCQWCSEPILPGEQSKAFDQPMHSECGIRAVAGSAAHIEKRCSCWVRGSSEMDNPALSKREAAREAYRAFLKANTAVISGPVKNMMLKRS